MSILASDIQIFKSSQPASDGGAISSTQIVDGTLNNLFPDTTGDQAAVGSVLYRKVFFKNNHSTLTLTAPVVWVATEPQSQESIDIGPALSHDDVDGTAISYSQSADKSVGIQVGDMAPGVSVGIWIRRTTPQKAVAFPASSVQLEIEGDTL